MCCSRAITPPRTLTVFNSAAPPSFPALKRSSTALQVRLADDSDFRSAASRHGVDGASGRHPFGHRRRDPDRFITIKDSGGTDRKTAKDTLRQYTRNPCALQAAGNDYSGLRRHAGGLAADAVGATARVTTVRKVADVRLTPLTSVVYFSVQGRPALLN